MARRLLVLLLIATIVACPLRCGGAFGVACAAEPMLEKGEERATCGCGCCRQEMPSTPESDPASPPPESCDCGGCVCEGAVLPERVLFVAEEAPAAPIGALLAWAILPEASQIEGREALSPDGKPSSSGRALRLLHRSLLL